MNGILIMLCVVSFILFLINIFLLNRLVKWKNIYTKLEKHAQNLKTENIKLQHDVYRLTYNIPQTENKKGKIKNGRK